MPEKVTKEESMVQKAIEAARLAKQMLEATGSAFEIPDAEEVKVKRPKAEKDIASSGPDESSTQTEHSLAAHRLP